MPLTKKSSNSLLRSSSKNSVKNSSKSSTKKITGNFGVGITKKFMEILMMIKMYHWNTSSYATHQATDELYSKINEHMDQFMEIFMGKTGKRIEMKSEDSITIRNLSSKSKLKSQITAYKSYLVNLNDNPFMRIMTNTDLFNIRDELLADLNQFLYLLSLK
jgi:DNA-binding ferritin-like protein